MRLDEAYARELDQGDDLAGFRAEFYLPVGAIYLDGNSLGLASRAAERALLQALDDWKTHAIDGWTAGARPWFYQAERLGERVATLVGAHADEVIVTGSISVNLHQLVAAFYQPDGAKTKILADALAFPTDIYVLQSQLRLRSREPAVDLVLVPSRDGRTLAEDDIIARMTGDIALVLLPSVLYRSGQLLDMRRLAAEAHARGILIGFDLAHSIGALPHALHEWGVDFAVWCHYKYLNAGPGAVGGLYVHRRHLGVRPGLAGWFGSDKNKQFDMAHDFTPAQSAGALQIGTPPIFSGAPLMGALEIFERAGIERIRAKSLAQTDYLIALAEHELGCYGFGIGTPREHARRGGHVSLEHADAARIAKALKAHGVVPDFRQPNVIRLAPVALYTSFQEVWEAVQRLRAIMANREYERYPNQRDLVA